MDCESNEAPALTLVGPHDAPSLMSAHIQYASRFQVNHQSSQEAIRHAEGLHPYWVTSFNYRQTSGVWGITVLAG